MTASSAAPQGPDRTRPCTADDGSGPPRPTGPRPPSVRPTVVVLVCALVLLQALALLAAAVTAAVVLVRGSDLPGPAVFLGVLAALVAVVLLAAARALWRGGSRWARSPVMTWQVLLGVLAVGWLGVESSVWAGAVLVVTVVTAVALVMPPVTAWTVPARDGRPGTPA